MTEIKIISISAKNKPLFDQISKLDEGFTDIVVKGLKLYLGHDLVVSDCPSFLADIKEWDKYIQSIPDSKKAEIMKRHAQIGNLLRRELYKLI